MQNPKNRSAATQAVAAAALCSVGTVWPSQAAPAGAGQHARTPAKTGGVAVKVRMPRNTHQTWQTRDLLLREADQKSFKLQHPFLRKPPQTIEVQSPAPRGLQASHHAPCTASARPKPR